MQGVIKKLIKEKQELDTKIHNLKRVIENLDYQLKPLTSEELQYIGAMIEQLASMKEYTKFLDKRIKILKHNHMAHFKEDSDIVEWNDIILHH